MAPNGKALAYIDICQQEFGIAAAISEDPNMLAAYISSDPYIAFGQIAGVLPKFASKSSHPQQRELFKETALGILYGMGIAGLSDRLNCTNPEAENLIQYHRRAFPKFWKWSENMLEHAELHGELKTLLGWNLKTKNQTSTSLSNFPMQANGAEFLRVLCCELNRLGVAVCAVIHDAILIETNQCTIHEAVNLCKRVIKEVSTQMFNGLALKSEHQIIPSGQRYYPEKGTEVWNRIVTFLETKGYQVRYPAPVKFNTPV
jgi:DNA polymerase I-like protein with 3'-5' exonuclease and polymerase domains